ncbi:hypothetical protein AB1462_16240 [Pseudomonas sp. SB113]|uniref:hypothetical protein n=1 Tax=Pseudomonas sp. SB113 TaxID=3154123 RepID=UPI00345D6E74
MDDEGDFKKARGFLLTYSALVLALWYFGADLTQFKLMGNEVQLHQRTNSAWLVLAVVNIYFWVRCYQRVPHLGLYFDKPMNDFYDTALVWIAIKLKLKRRYLRKDAEERFAKNNIPSRSMHIISYGVETTVQRDLNEDQQRNGDEAPSLHQISRKARVKMKFSVAYAIQENGQPTSITGSWALNHEPEAFLTWPVKAFAIARGAFITPWFTDHIAPLVLGGISTSFALWKWCEVNFFTTRLSYSALMCF